MTKEAGGAKLAVSPVANELLGVVSAHAVQLWCD